MKIAWLIQGDEQYGIRSGSKAFLLALQASNIECPIMALAEGEFTEECKSIGLNVTVLNAGDTPRIHGGWARKTGQYAILVRHELKVSKLVTTVLKQLNADALHFRRPNFVGIAGRAAFANGIRSFWHMPNVVGNNYPFELNRRIYQFQCKRYGIVPLANSQYTATTLGTHPVCPRVLYLGVDPDRFDPCRGGQVHRDSFGIDATAIVFGIVGRLNASKGQDRVIRASSRLIRDGHDIHIMIIGGPIRGDYYDQLKALNEKSGLGKRVHLVGPVSDAERYYHMMDFSLNSYIHSEAFGISVVESMMSGRPALVHAAGGPAETVIDGVTGWHFPTPSDEDIHRGILRAIADRDRWPEMRRSARQHAVKNFSLTAQSQRYLSIVRNVLDEEPESR